MHTFVDVYANYYCILFLFSLDVNINVACMQIQLFKHAIHVMLLLQILLVIQTHYVIFISTLSAEINTIKHELPEQGRFIIYLELQKTKKGNILFLSGSGFRVVTANNSSLLNLEEKDIH
ncbi:hypothetical protein ACJX0J_010186, partial [Zea mays]